MPQAVSLQVRTTTLIILFLRPLDSVWKHSIDSPGSPPCQLTLQTLGLVSLHNLVGQFLITSLPVSLTLCLSPCFSFCLSVSMFVFVCLSLSFLSSYIYRYRCIYMYMYTLHIPIGSALWRTLTNTKSDSHK